ncbi:unnamed protein product [Chironomus riparius]|uniref:Uncharacterized protein n=1 Tax=Chironomus riparius TaxID=315576 RepID=A0A9N9RJL3_9DIPT|nr:unnamed protein product [Chironomus riparius]
MSTVIDDDVLQICASHEDLLGETDDAKYLNSEVVVLKFINKNGSKIISFTGSIHKLLMDNNVKIKGIYWKGDYTCLIEVLLTDFLEIFLIALVGARNNSRTVSDKTKKDILKNCFGKFSIILLNEIICMIVVPHISEKLIECKSTYYPFGHCTGNVINLITNCLKESPELIVKKIIKELNNGNKLIEIYGYHIECSGKSDYALRFFIKTSSINNNVMRSLNAAFGSLSFCSSTLHLIPEVKSSEFSNAMNSSLNSKQLWSALSEIDVLNCNSNEQALAMKRNTPTNVNLTPKPTDRKKITATSSQSSSSIFSRLGPRINTYRSHLSSDTHPYARTYLNLQITARFSTSSSSKTLKSKSRH